MHRESALGVVQQQVADAHVGESAAHHHFVVAAPGAEGVELPRLDPDVLQEPACGTVARDGSRRRDVVGGGGVAEHRQHPGSLDVGEGLRLRAHPLEEGGQADVGRGRIPVVEPPRIRLRQRLPQVVAFEDLRVTALVHLRPERALNGIADFLRRRPDVGEEHGFAVGPCAQGLLGEVDVDAARERERDHQDRRRQVVAPDLLVDARLEVAVAAQGRGHHQPLVLDGRDDGVREGAAVADTGGAAVSHHVEPEGVQVAGEVGGVQVVAHHLRPRRHAGLDPVGHGEAARQRVPGQQSGTHHHRRVGGVGAARDGRDDQSAVRDLGGAGLEVDLDRAPIPVCRGCRTARAGAAVGLRERDARTQPREVPAEARTEAGEGDAVLRPLRPRHRRLHRGEVDLQVRRVLGVRCLVGAEESLFLAVALHPFHDRCGAPGAAQVFEGAVVHGEKADGGTVLGRHVGDRGAVGQRKGGKPRPEVLDEAGHHPVRAQLLGHGEHQVGGGRALLQGAGELHPDHLRQQHVVGLPEQDRLGLDAADPPAHHPQPVDHGGVRVRAHQRVGAGDPGVAVPAALHHRREVLKVDLVHDARAGRHHAEVAEGILSPA